MATMNVSLPEELRARVDALVHAGEYQTNSDYVRELIRADLERRAESQRLHALLDEAMRGPFIPFDDAALKALEETLVAEIQRADT
jgi:antitoxin ParD1/3/4